MSVDWVFWYEDSLHFPFLIVRCVKIAFKNGDRLRKLGICCKFGAGGAGKLLQVVKTWTMRSRHSLVAFLWAVAENVKACKR